jgi:uncharacterized CHY-type Zn-finger protein
MNPPNQAESQGEAHKEKRKDVRGVDVDSQTRCDHYHLPVDVIAIKMKCCGVFYACKECHEALAGHPIRIWPHSEWEERAVLCGVCSYKLTIHEYMHCDDRCPQCLANFNPGCRNHYQFYFETLNPDI